MTGYVFAKICKYKEIDALFLKNKMRDKKSNHYKFKGKGGNKFYQTEDDTDASESLQKPATLKNTKV